MDKTQDGKIYYYYVPAIVQAVVNNGSRRTHRVHNYVVSGYELIVDRECMEMLDDMIEEHSKTFYETCISEYDFIESVSITGIYESNYDSKIKWLETDV